MSSINKVMLIGRLGRDPEIRTTQGGHEIANFSIATSEIWKDKSSGEKKEKTEWTTIVVFGNSVNFVKNYIVKGSQVFIEGRLQTRNWEDKSGNKRYSTEVIAQQVQLLSGGKDKKQTGSNETKSDNYQKQNNYADDIVDDEIPF